MFKPSSPHPHNLPASVFITLNCSVSNGAALTLITFASRGLQELQSTRGSRALRSVLPNRPPLHDNLALYLQA